MEETMTTATIADIAGGEKAKARDILAAIRALRRIEDENRPATADEQAALARFAGFGPVALSIFPNPVTGAYKDAGWQALGDELKALLSPEEYDSARRTVFNAFYTSPTVIAAMHRAIARLGVAGDATVLEPGCGTGHFLGQAAAGLKFILIPGFHDNQNGTVRGPNTLIVWTQGNLKMAHLGDELEAGKGAAKKLGGRVRPDSPVFALPGDDSQRCLCGY